MTQLPDYLDHIVTTILTAYDGMTAKQKIWLAIGFFGQALFFGRFFVQWIASERARKSVIPNTFWYFSIGGGLILFIYAIYKRDPVFILGQGTGMFIYLRNLYFIHGKPATIMPAEARDK